MRQIIHQILINFFIRNLFWLNFIKNSTEILGIKVSIGQAINRLKNGIKLQLLFTSRFSSYTGKKNKININPELYM